MKRDEEGIAAAVAPSADGRLDELGADESRVIADGDMGWGGRLLVRLFFATELRPFGDGIVKLLFV